MDQVKVQFGGDLARFRYGSDEVQEITGDGSAWRQHGSAKRGNGPKVQGALSTLGGPGGEDAGAHVLMQDAFERAACMQNGCAPIHRDPEGALVRMRETPVQRRVHQVRFRCGSGAIQVRFVGVQVSAYQCERGCERGLAWRKAGAA